MSRTNKDKGTPNRKDYGGRYKVDKHYMAGAGKVPKKAANRERREQSKIELLHEDWLNELKTNEHGLGHMAKRALKILNSDNWYEETAKVLAIDKIKQQPFFK